MSAFTSPVELRQLVTPGGRPILRGDRSQWVPTKAIPYEVGEEGSGVFITVPAWDFGPYTDWQREHWTIYAKDGAFASDLGSIPAFLRGIPGYSPDGEGLGAYLVHDLLYATQGLWGIYTRSQADKILVEALKALGVGPQRRAVIYRAVRLGGKGGWGK